MSTVITRPAPTDPDAPQLIELITLHDIGQAYIRAAAATAKLAAATQRVARNPSPRNCAARAAAERAATHAESERNRLTLTFGALLGNHVNVCY